MRIAVLACAVKRAPVDVGELGGEGVVAGAFPVAGDAVGAHIMSDALNAGYVLGACLRHT